MWIETTETIHPTQHCFPVNWFLGSSKTKRAHLMAVRTHHFKIQLVPGIFKIKHTESAVRRSLQF